MADLEDAESGLAEQERWGLSRIGAATKQLAAALRALRVRVATHDQRLDQIERRLDALDTPKGPPQ